MGFGTNADREQRIPSDFASLCEINKTFVPFALFVIFVANDPA
jgi:hypothetical protein